MNTAYKLTPGSTIARVVELLRFLPKGTALRPSELRTRLEMKECSDLNKQLAPAAKHGLLRREVRPSAWVPSRRHLLDGR